MILKKLLLLPLFILLFSCGVSEPVLPREFSADIAMTANGKQYEAVYEKRSEGDFLRFSMPERISGVQFFLKDGVCTVEMEELSFESDEFKSVFDFLPIECEGEKTAGFRKYRIFNVREIK